MYRQVYSSTDMQSVATVQNIGVCSDTRFGLTDYPFCDMSISRGNTCILPNNLFIDSCWQAEDTSLQEGPVVGYLHWGCPSDVVCAPQDGFGAHVVQGAHLHCHILVITNAHTHTHTQRHTRISLLGTYATSASQCVQDKAREVLILVNNVYAGVCHVH